LSTTGRSRSFKSRAALDGRKKRQKTVRERNGETIALATDDRIELDESMVFLFRTAPKRHLHQRMVSELCIGHAHHDMGEQVWHVAA
jgi:hypothetical protein